MCILSFNVCVFHIQTHLSLCFCSFLPSTWWCNYLELTLPSNCLSYCPLREYSWGGKKSLSLIWFKYCQPQRKLHSQKLIKNAESFLVRGGKAESARCLAAAALCTLGWLTYTTFFSSYGPIFSVIPARCVFLWNTWISTVTFICQKIFSIWTLVRDMMSKVNLWSVVYLESIYRESL